MPTGYRTPLSKSFYHNGLISVVTAITRQPTTRMRPLARCVRPRRPYGHGRFPFSYLPIDFPIFTLNCQPRLQTLENSNASDRPKR